MAEARDELQKMTECCICLKTFTDPRMLPCIHTFCLECLIETGKAAKKEPGENLSCPLCRKLFVIPTEGMNGLQRNFFMQHLMDVKPTIREGQKSVTDCDICKVIHEGDKEKTKEATMLCLECGDNFCDECAKVHKLHKSSKTHSIVNIGIETEVDFRKLQPGRSCAVHNQQPLNFYCADCKKIICVSCFVENHASHKCKDVTSLEKKFRKRIEMNASKISVCAEEMLSIGKKVEQRSADVLLKLAEIEDKIRQRNVELKEMIDSHTNFLLRQLSVIKQQHFKDIVVEEEEIERIRGILKSFETYCNELNSKGSASDVCDCVEELVKRAYELEKDHEAFIGRPYQRTEVYFKATTLEQILVTFRGNILGEIQEVKLKQGHRNTRGIYSPLNAVIQCLSYTVPLLEELSYQPLTEAFVALLKYTSRQCSPEYTSKEYSPEQNEAFSNIFRQLYRSSPKFRQSGQHDSHDNFIQFLNEIRSEERNRVKSAWWYGDIKKTLTPVDKVFGGHFITIYDCLNCNRSNCVCDCLLDITVPISIPTHQHHQINNGVRTGGPSRISSKQVYLMALNEEHKTPIDVGGRPVTLTECLRLYTLTEHIPEGHQCRFCRDGLKAAAVANARTMPPDSAMKRTLIYDPPVVLVLHIKRFEETANGFTKLSDKVTYEEFLDLGPYCSSDCQRIDPEDKNVWYSLFGVVVHNGSVESGHYSAYVNIRYSEYCIKSYLQRNYLSCDEVASQQLKKSQKPSKTKNVKVEYHPQSTTVDPWIFADDDNTRQATLEEALNQEAFMLFYERVPGEQLFSYRYSQN